MKIFFATLMLLLGITVSSQEVSFPDHLNIGSRLQNQVSELNIYFQDMTTGAGLFPQLHSLYDPSQGPLDTVVKGMVRDFAANFVFDPATETHMFQLWVNGRMDIQGHDSVDTVMDNRQISKQPFALVKDGSGKLVAPATALSGKFEYLAHIPVIVPGVTAVRYSTTMKDVRGIEQTTYIHSTNGVHIVCSLLGLTNGVLYFDWEFAVSPNTTVKEEITLFSGDRFATYACTNGQKIAESAPLPPSVGIAGIKNGVIQLKIGGAPGRVLLQRSLGFSSDGWTDVATLTVPSSYEDTNSGPQAFYRLLPAN